MAKILIVEDDRTVAELLQTALQSEGHEAHLAPDPSQAALDTFDLLLLDLVLPETNGLALARRIRDSHDLPIIMVTARDQVQDRLAGFEAGADDYITKPFSFQELLARIRAVLHRTRRQRVRLEVGPLAVDLEQREARWHGERLELRRREFELLATLAQRPGRVYCRQELLDRIWGLHFEGESNVLEVAVHRLRERLGHQGPQVIATVRGFGYTLRLP